MIKLSKKQLKDLAISLGAYYCGGNVYNHENIAIYLSMGACSKLREYSNTKNDVSKLLEDLNQLYGLSNIEDKHEYSISSTQIAYSCTNAGNTGQIIKYTVVSKNTTGPIYDFYTYYC